MNTKICPTCKTPIPAHAPGGFCPACILRGADELPPLGRTAPSLAEVSAAFPQLEVLGLIGQGGMGFVYKVRQPSLDRTVALKILSPELGRDPAFAERFAREARVLGKLNHPNIVTVFESGVVAATPSSQTEQNAAPGIHYYYLIMEFVDGVNLRQAMRAGRFTPAQALAVVPGICDALGAAHAQGVWHRDIKPENILLDAQGGVKIVDFGIARIVGDPQRDFTLTMTGAALGSAAYMAPEQHESPHDVDHRADIYSLGVVIYEMLTGELPLGRFPAPSERAAVSARIDEIVFQTLEKERNLRQQSAEEVKTDVHRAAKHADAAPETRGDLPAKVTLWALGLILAGLLFGGAGAGIFLIGETMRDAHSWLVAGVSIFAIGAIAFVLGFAGACYALWQMHRGLIPPVWRPLLRVLTVVPWLLEIAERCWSNADDVSSTSRAVVIAILTGGVAAGVAGVFNEFKPIWSEKGHFFITGLIVLTVIVGIGRLGWSQLLRHDGIGTERTAFWAGFAALVFTIVGAIEAKRFDGQWPTSYALAKAEIRLTEDSSLTDARLQQAYEIAAGPYTNKHRMEHVGQTIHLSVVGLGYLSGDNVPAATLLNSLIRRFFETLDDTERTSIKSIETFGGDRYLPRNTRQAVYIVLLSGIGLAGVIIVTVGRRGLWARFAMCASVLVIGFALPVWRSSAISPFTPDPVVGPALADIPIAERTPDFSTPVGAARALCDAAQARNVAGVLAAIIPAEREADEDPDDYARVIMATYGQGRAAFSKPRPDLGTQVIVPTKFFVFQSFGTNHPAGGDLRASANENRIVCVQTPEGWRVKTSAPPKNRLKVAAKNAGPSKAADQAEEIRSQQPKTAEEIVERLKTGAKERPIGFSARASVDAPVSTMEPLAPSLPPGPAISAEDVLRKLNVLANESNGEEFKKQLSVSTYGKEPGGNMAARMEPFLGKLRLVKTVAHTPGTKGLFPIPEKTTVFASFERADGKMSYHEFDFTPESGEWRYDGANYPEYRAVVRVEFRPESGNATAILRAHLDNNVVSKPVAGADGQFDIESQNPDAVSSANIANAIADRLKDSLKKVGLDTALKVIKKAEVPTKPIHAEEELESATP